MSSSLSLSPTRRHLHQTLTESHRLVHTHLHLRPISSLPRLLSLSLSLSTLLLLLLLLHSPSPTTSIPLQGETNSPPTTSVWQELITLDCSGTLHLFPSHPILSTSVQAQIWRRAYDYITTYIRERVGEFCPSLTQDELSDGYSYTFDNVFKYIFNQANNTPPSIISEKCPNTNIINFDTKNFDVSSTFPSSTCSYTRWQDTNHETCTFQVNHQIYQNDVKLQVAIAKCSDSNLPFVSISCNGGFCQRFLRPCVSNSDCGSNLCRQFKGPAATDFGNEELSNLLDSIYVFPDYRTCNDGQTQLSFENVGRKAVSALAAFLVKRVGGSSLDWQGKFCGLEYFQPDPLEPVTSDQVRTFAENMFDCSSTGCTNFEAWDPPTMANGVSAIAAERKSGAAFTPALLGSTTPDVLPTDTRMTLLHVDCDTRITMFPGTPWTLNANLLTVHDALQHIFKYVIQPLHDCSTGFPGTTDSMFTGLWDVLSPIMWLRAATFTDGDESLRNLGAWNNFTTAFAGVQSDGVLNAVDEDADFTYIKLPRSCSITDFMSRTGRCTAKLDFTDLFGGLQLALQVTVTRCSTDKQYALPDIKLECVGQHCTNVFRNVVPEPCNSDADCPVGRKCHDVPVPDQLSDAVRNMVGKFEYKLFGSGSISSLAPINDIYLSANATRRTALRNRVYDRLLARAATTCPSFSIQTLRKRSFLAEREQLSRDGWWDLYSGVFSTFVVTQYPGEPNIDEYCFSVYLTVDIADLNIPNAPSAFSSYFYPVFPYYQEYVYYLSPKYPSNVVKCPDGTFRLDGDDFAWRRCASAPTTAISPLLNPSIGRDVFKALRSITQSTELPINVTHPRYCAIDFQRAFEDDNFDTWKDKLNTTTTVTTAKGKYNQFDLLSTVDCTGSDCNCLTGYTGPNCESCAIGYTKRDGYCVSIAPNQPCQFGVETTEPGVCSCNPGYGGEKCDRCALNFAGTKCDECAENFFGPDCIPCPGVHSRGAVCSGKGTCDDGKDGSGKCTCNANSGYSGSLCDEPVFQDWLATDCTGNVHLFSSHPLLNISVNTRGVAKRAFDSFTQSMRDEAACFCPSLTTEQADRMFLVSMESFMQSVFLGPVPGVDCAGTRRIDTLISDSNLNLSRSLPASTCSWASWNQPDGNCAFTFDTAFGAQTLQFRLGIAKCPDTRVPLLSLSCAGDMCAQFMRPCQSDSDCNSGSCRVLRRNAVNDITDALKKALHPVGFWTDWDSDHPLTAFTQSTIGAFAWQGISDLLVQFSGGTRNPGVKFCGLDPVLGTDEQPPAQTTVDKWDNFVQNLTDPCSRDDRCTNLGAWDGILASGERFDSPGRRSGELLADFPVFPDKSSVNEYVVFDADCNTRVSLFPSFTVGVQMDFLPVHRILQTIYERVVVPLSHIRTGFPGIGQRQMEATLSPFTTEFWLRMMTKTTDEYLTPFNVGTQIWTMWGLYQRELFKIKNEKFNALKMPASCSAEHYRATGECDLEFSGLDTLFLVSDMKMRLSLSRCNDVPFALPHIRVSCVGADCPKVFEFYKYQACESSNDCAGQPCSDLPQVNMFNGLYKEPKIAVYSSYMHNDNITWLSQNFNSIDKTKLNEAVVDAALVGLANAYNPEQVDLSKRTYVQGGTISAYYFNSPIRVVRTFPGRPTFPSTYFSNAVEISVSLSNQPQSSVRDGGYVLFVVPNAYEEQSFSDNPVIWCPSLDAIRPFNMCPGNDNSRSLACNSPYRQARAFSKYIHAIAETTPESYSNIAQAGFCKTQIQFAFDDGRFDTWKDDRITHPNDHTTVVSGLAAPPAQACDPAVQCNGRGVCGADFASPCTCTIGNWQGARCNQCPFPYTGTDCNQCQTGFSGINNNCADCAAGYWGSSCSPCPGLSFDQNNVPRSCNGNGVCDDGRQFSGKCYCDPGHFGVDCSQVPVCGNGVLEAPSELCDTGSTGVADGCTNCIPDDGFICFQNQTYTPPRSQCVQLQQTSGGGVKASVQMDASSSVRTEVSVKNDAPGSDDGRKVEVGLSFPSGFADVVDVEIFAKENLPSGAQAPPTGAVFDSIFIQLTTPSAQADFSSGSVDFSISLKDSDGNCDCTTTPELFYYDTVTNEWKKTYESCQENGIPGQNSFQCSTCTLSTNVCHFTNFAVARLGGTLPGSDDGPGVIMYAAAGAGVLIIALVVVWCCKRRKKQQQQARFQSGGDHHTADVGHIPMATTSSAAAMYRSQAPANTHMRGSMSGEPGEGH
jgi:hypothetical protein